MTNLRRTLKGQAALFLSLNFVILLIWVILKRKWDLDSWNLPISYTWDAWSTLSQIKAFGSQIPFAFKNIADLNAPFSANWTDWPFGDDFLFFFLSRLGRLTNIFFASNIAVLSAHLLAATTFFWSALRLKISKPLAWIGAMAFALSPYFFSRGLQHLILTHAWHLPLLFVFAEEFLEAATVTKFLKRFGLLLALLGGLLYVYYTYIFLQVFVFLFLFSILKKQWPKTRFLFLLLLICSFGALLGQLDTIFYQLKNGPNTTAMTRALFEVELYALKLPDLFLPFHHRLSFLNYLTDRFYFNHQLLIQGELGYPYLGFIGILCFLIAISRRMFLIFKSQSMTWSFNEGFLVWIISLSLVGGINMLIAVLTGFYGFRCSNRFSIVILALVLLIGLRVMSQFLSSKKQLVLFPLLFLLIVIDLPSRESSLGLESLKSKVESDRSFVEGVESQLTGQNMVFQLPVVDYPETPPPHLMSDYDHFRPYFYSKKIHWSYGSTKGRAREAWQHTVENESPDEMIHHLQNFGFSGMLINRLGYKDAGQDLERKLVAMGYNISVESSDKELAFVSLTPVSNPILPSYPPFFEAGWYPAEKDLDGEKHWTEKWGTIAIDNTTLNIKNVRLQMKIQTLSPQTIHIYLGSNETSFHSNALDEVYEDVITLSPGKNLIKFAGSNRPQKPSSADRRYLSFAIKDFSVTEIP